MFINYEAKTEGAGILEKHIMKGNRGKNGYDGKSQERFLCISNDEIPGGSHAGALHVQTPDGRGSLFPFSLLFNPIMSCRDKRTGRSTLK